ncbi:coiled-coil domain-containing protein 62 isoform X2 [Phyllopteryx taeniolatus]|uniref:coiled-coil domain-containing protein 62 isoform X2 n=1 Tax=Phyllopteryx taeniolatus TaxID=161469 RepID=UPI002AD44F72|nr:coiled-coil domain-containing protein 62 isoform X2 [Phyllopteryx taeniolatus]
MEENRGWTPVLPPDSSAAVWHSNPVKQDVPLHGPTAHPFNPRMQHSEVSTNQLSASDAASCTIQRQRREIKLLMAELKERECELNAMAASHQRCLRACEGDRRQLLESEQKQSRLEEELQKRNEVIRALTKRVQLVEAREKEVRKELRAALQRIEELQENQKHMRHTCQDYEEKNHSLNSKVMILTTEVGSLKVKEEELSSRLKIKDKDASEASGHVVHLTGRLRETEAALAESRSREAELLREEEANRRRLKEARRDNARLREELQQQVTQGSAQREETIRLKQEVQLLRQDLALSGEGDSWKDELLELARSKQDRAVSELQCLRQVYESQRNELQLLHVNLESARVAVRKDHHGSQDLSSESMRGKTSPQPDHLSSPGRVHSGVLASLLTHSGDVLSDSLLQQLLDHSPRSGAPSRPLETSSYSHNCQTDHQHVYTPPAQSAEAPPKESCRSARQGGGQAGQDSLTFED